MTKILLAEDNEMNRELMVTILDHNSFQTTTAGNGEEAVELAMSMRPDLVLMDIQMPVVDGFSALEKIREQTELSHIPVVAITGNVMPHDLERIKTCGFNGVVHKPFRINELLDTINEVLNHN
ncbi:MAG: response regulator [Pseudohongiellaceae bacterium]